MLIEQSEDEDKIPRMRDGGRGGSGYTLFNFRLLFVNQVYHEVRDGRKVLIKEIVMQEEKSSPSPVLVTS